MEPMTEAGFFDSVYANAGGDDASVPWQHTRSRQLINDWFEGYAPTGTTRALVVAAGLGDDAATLARKGAGVTAFDFSPTAVAWAQDRHAGLGIDWHEADLFDLPATWHQAFDLVIEVFTIQSIPPPRQEAAAEVVRGLVTEGGTLVAVFLAHHGDGVPHGPPWPLAATTVELLTRDLRAVSRVDESVDDTTSIALAELARPVQ
jgi:SAM-dependent methyltransferase